ncbi:hypothetical protein KY320_02485 [Candidatus Woesearchaeota archaeon]|nr:hypothetical protein [Candidatus Woesearchaeota archaeon]
MILTKIIIDRPHSRIGIIFTLDAVLAVLLGLVLVFAALSMISKSSISYTQATQERFALDNLAILEKTGLLQLSVSSQDYSALQHYIDNTPDNICLKLEIMDSTDMRILSILKKYCTISDTQSIARRVFITDNQIFIAEMEVWIG